MNPQATAADGFPLSPQQRRIWACLSRSPEGALGASITLLLSGDLDLAALESALSNLVAGHEILRTSFPRVPGLSLPVQSILPAEPVALAAVEAGARLDAPLPPAAPGISARLERVDAREHRLHLRLSPLLCDRVSLGNLVSDLARAYGAAPGERPPWEDALQYADAAEWLNRLLEDEERADARAAWSDVSGADLALSRAPFARPQGAFAPRATEVPLPSGRGFALAARAAALDATLEDFALAAWLVQLQRLTERPRLVVGLGLAGRRYEELAGAIGPFARTAPVAVVFDGRTSWRRLLAEVAARTAEAEEWQDYFSWDALAAAAGEPAPRFGLSFSALPRIRPATGKGVTFAPLDLSVVDELFELRLERDHGPSDEPRWRLAYDAGAYSAVAAGRLATQLATVLDAAAAADPEAPVGAIGLLSNAERRRLIVDFNATDRELTGAPLADRIAAAAKAAPDRCAAIDAKGELSYAQLARRSRLLAHRLTALGIGPEARVGLCYERSTDLLVALLATLEAGAAFVPLDPEAPAERLLAVARDARLALLFGRAEPLSRSGLAALGLPVLDLAEMDWDAPLLEQATRPCALPENLAYAIYTSGSTGRPKGVMVSRRALHNYLSWSAAEYGAGEGGGALVHSPLAFDLTITGLLAPLAAGGRVRLLAPGNEIDGLAEAIAEESDLALVKLTPSHLDLLAVLLPADRPAARIGGLVIGGEALFGEGVRGWRERSPEIRLINEYGPTEATVGCAVYEIPPGPVAAGPVPIGRPIANARLYLVDREMAPVAMGVAGEILIGGVGLARGYLGRPDLSAERFVPDPFSGLPGERLYRSGDLARHLPEGELLYLGREDGQVKIRGHRIELGEVEAVLREHPGVREAAVVTAGEAGDRRLVAYVSSASARSPEADELRRFAAARLPEPMVPSSWAILASLPLTPNGKIDRAALPALEQVAGPFEPPATPTEEILAGLWEEVLGVRAIGRGDDFFALGGHSLLASRVVSRLRSVFAVEMPVRSFFAEPTLAALAHAVDAARGAVAPEAQDPIVPLADRAAAPLSFAQQRLWFLDQLAPGNPAYNIAAALRLRGELDRRALGAALAEAARRHEVLRTAFVGDEGRPRLEPRPKARLGLPAIDLAGLDTARRERELSRLAAAEALLPFDLSRTPLARARLCRLGHAEHALFFTLHHIASDLWSMGILVSEVGALYASARAGLASPLPELPIQYADFAAWQRRVLSGTELERRLAYWRGALAGLPPALALATDRPRPHAPTWRGEIAPFRSAELAPALRRLAREQGATPFMVLVAALQTLLGRWGGERDLAVGTPIAGRDRLETEGLIGFFVNTLVLRGDLSGDPSFAALLARTREACLEAFAHEDLPFERLVEELQPERSLAQAPLFQILFAFQNAPALGLALPGLTAELLPATSSAAKLDLAFAFEIAEDVEGRGESLVGGLEYATELFDAATIERLLDGFAVLLAASAADPSRRLSDLPLAGPAERRQLLARAEGGRAGYGLGACLHELFEAQADRSPGRIAAVFEGSEITYAALEARANGIAHRLREKGVRPGVAVALAVEPSFDLLAALLGVLKAGGAYVPLDPGYPPERLAFMLADSGAPVLLAAGAGRDLGLRAEETLDPGATPAGPTERLAATAGPDDLAYLIYTSGSTGRPKGVMMPHRGIVNRLLWMQQETPITSADRVLHKTPISFDASIWELFLPWLAGATAVIARPGGHRDTGYLAEVVAAERVSVLQLVPSLVPPFLEEPGAARAAGLRRLFCGGEAVPPTLPEQVFARLRPAEGEIELHNLYGPTEAAIDAAHRRILPGERHPGAAVSIGRPIANDRIYLINGGALAPTGVAGELAIGGAGLARGYQGRADLTAERFVPDPWSGEGGARLYRTGDRARWLADGTIEFLGRLDGQVKLRGVRIETGEIEAALLAVPGVREAAVALVDRGTGPRLVGYFVAPADLAAEPAEVRRALARRLPEAMVPEVLIPLPALPRTPNGKLDRRALPVPAAGGPAAGAEPATVSEQIVAAIWSDLLGLDSVGAGDDFFALGGHSLLATQAMARVRRAFGVELPLSALISAPTVSALAAAIDGARGAAAVFSPPRPAPGVERRGVYPLSFAQRRFWFLDQLEPGNAAYNLSTALLLSGPLDRAALVSALAAATARQEALRTRIAEGDEEPVQVVEEDLAPRLPLIDLSSGGGREAARALAALEAARPFDLSLAPLWRVRLARLGPREHLLVVTIHHLIADGWSLGVLVREVAEAYAAAREGRPNPLPDLPVQMGDFAVWQRDRLAGDELERQVGYWRRHLAGAPAALDLLTDRPRPPAQTYRGEGFAFELPPDLARDAGALSRRRGTTPFMFLLAGFYALLARTARQDDVVVGVPTANRTSIEAEGLIGLFVNTLALRARVAPRTPFSALLAEVRTAVLGGTDHQELPFERLVEELNPERDFARSPIFQVLFNLQNAPAPALALAGLRIEQLPVEQVSAQFDLTLHLTEEAGTLRGWLIANADLFDRATSERFAGRYLRLLASAAAAPEEALGDLGWLGDQEIAQLTAGWNDTAVLWPDGGSLPRRIAARAAAHPGAPAVAQGDAGLTYGELSKASGLLSRRLFGLGIRFEEPVGIFLDRSPEMVVALLAVLATGAAYLPLDPLYPRDRLAHMLADSGARWVISRGEMAAELAPFPVAVLRLDEPEGAEPAGPFALPEPDPSSLAYVIYTSGSTGRPKGVEVTHGGLLNFLLSMARTPGLASTDRLLALTSLSFDIAGLELFLPLLVGAAVEIAPAEAALDGALLGGLLARPGTTAMQATPSTWRVLLDSGWSGEPRLAALVGGEALPPDLARRLRTKVGALWNLYGPTETTIWSTLEAVEAPVSSPVPIGRPIANTTVYVLDEALHPSPVSCPGDLYIGGAGVARGYRGRADLTAERFVPDPLGQGARLYRTGDLARWLPEGRLEFLGRTDQQVKVRGFRIEPGEIEVALAEVPGVEVAIVVVHAEPEGGRLVAYVSPAGAPEPALLRAALRGRLPEYMVPGAFVVLDAMPLTPNGKVDRKELSRRAPSHAASKGEGVAPRTPTERALFEIWSAVLGHGGFGVEDSFFDLGGHSLLATRVAARVRRELSVDLPVRDFLLAPTIAELASRIEDLLLASVSGEELDLLFAEVAEGEDIGTTHEVME